MRDLNQILEDLGCQLREARNARGWSAKALAERSGVSERLVFQVEKGQANVSVGKLYLLAEALELSLEGLLSARRSPARCALDAALDDLSPGALERLRARLERERVGDDDRRVISLLGMRGAGKSTVGERLAAALGVAFVELDARVEARASLSLSEIFSMHGPEFYEQLERDCLAALINEETPVVVATGGGIVTHDAAYELLTRRTLCVWLRASPEAHWRRVIEQGDHRPMTGHPRAFEQLCAILEARTPRYEEADVIIDTSDAIPEQVVEVTLEALRSRRAVFTGRRQRA